MSDIKISQLIPAGTLIGADLIEVSQDVSTTPVSRAASMTQVYSWVVSSAASTWQTQTMTANSYVLDISHHDTRIRRGGTGGNFLFDDNGLGFSAKLSPLGQVIGDQAFNTFVPSSDTFSRFAIDYGARLYFGPGTTSYDIRLGRVPSAIALQTTCLAGGSNHVDFYNSGRVLVNADQGTIDASADLEIITDTSNPRGTLLNRGTTANRLAISSPAEGLIFYDTTLHALMIYNGTSWVPMEQLAGNVVYVSPNGTDAVGNGGIFNPYATVSYALSQITTASGANPFTITVSGGQVNDAGTILLKPFVNLKGETQGTILNNSTADIGIDTTAWNVSSNQSCYIQDITISNSVNLDFSGVSNGGNIVQLDNVLINNNLSAIGNAGAHPFIYLYNNFIFNNSFFDDCTVSESLGNNYFNISLGSISNTANTHFHSWSDNIEGTLSGTSVGSTNTIINIIGADTFGSPITMSGTNANLIADSTSLSTAPILNAGATIQYYDSGDSIASTESRTNYTPSSQTVEGNFEGIDTALGAKQPTGNYITALTGDVGATGPGSVAATIQSGAVTGAKIATNTVANSNLAQMATNTIKGNNTGGTANAADLTVTQVLALLALNQTSNQLVYGNGASGVTSSASLTFDGTDIINTAGGIKLQTSGGTPAALNYYEEGSFTITLTGPAVVTPQIFYVRVGKIVTLSLVGSGALTSTAATHFTGSAQIPARLRPEVGCNEPIFVQDNGINQPIPGYINISNGGDIDIFKTYATGTFTGVGTCSFNSKTISYRIT